ncbi:DUF1624 domain-containing protein [Mesorhizobium sp. J428]|uniref:DUF1624 domain-containing protein n=1 Tax=Mesorhizobium sp. J428 TaxID=2898440 RepID=UPI0021514A3F|nr:DUF1624 domain-containing protein [Mesorhizobium sp. J428]MCR5860003.1 DUF1624 domain-containing protein [Mesorhizobium sp. J428]
MSSVSPRSRIEWIDLARGVALVAMAIYHFTWDLEFFGYTEPGMTAVGGWKLFARGIASTFLVLVGVSLYLAHAKGIRWPGFWRRFAMIVAAALAITIATWFATPDFFIFFGILHQIAFASVAGLLFLRFPAIVTLVVAVLVIALPNLYATTLLDGPWGWWTGLSETRPRSSDFVPVFPWFGAVLIGLALARFASAAGLFERLAAVSPGARSRPLRFIGRHSLAFYLIHQPVLISCIWLFSQVVPPVIDHAARFRPACERSCTESRSATFCTAYCTCMLDGLRADNLLEQAFSRTPSDEFRGRLRDMAEMCTAVTEGSVQGEDEQ